MPFVLGDYLNMLGALIKVPHSEGCDGCCCCFVLVFQIILEVTCSKKKETLYGWVN